MSGRISFERVNRAALPVLPSLLARWLPGGRIAGDEYVALNPRRCDHRLGSFRVNLRTGRWADFAIAHARGGDVVSLGAEGYRGYRTKPERDGGNPGNPAPDNEVPQKTH
jgi:hypothetical protein